jgi:hypothetical protein
MDVFSHFDTSLEAAGIIDALISSYALYQSSKYHKKELNEAKRYSWLGSP